MNKSESKYFNTAIRMNEALISLLQKKELEYISIKEICEVAQVNRSTFYLHYENIYDLLSETLKYINNKFLKIYNSDITTTTVQKIKNGTTEELLFVTPEYLIPYLNFIKENKNIFIATLKHPKVFQTNKKYSNLYLYFFKPIFEKYSLPKDEHEYIISFYIRGIIGIITI